MSLVWMFVAITSLTDGGPHSHITSPRYASEEACETARSTWLREQKGPIYIIDLKECEPRKVKRGKAS